MDTITLTPAQAAALGYTFEIEPIEDSSKTLWNSQPGANVISKNDEETVGSQVSVYQDFTTTVPQNKIELVSNCDVQDWNAIKNINSQGLENFKVASNAGRAQKKIEKFNTAKNVTKLQQFVKKSAQSVTKNVRILPNVGKVDGESRKFQFELCLFVLTKTG